MIKQLFFALAVVFTLNLQAQNLPENFYLDTLDNGLELLVIEDNSVPLVTIEIAVRNGAYTEDKEFDGLSHLYEHMFFKANKDYPSQEKYMERVQELGIVFNGTTSTDKVNYFITLTNDKLKEGLEFMNSAIRYPLFDTVEMRKENPVVDAEFKRAESNPQTLLYWDVQRKMYGDLYSRKNTIGDHDVILTATPKKMQIIKEKYYHPNNTLLSIAGDVNHAEVATLISDIFGDWEHSGFDPQEKYPVPEFPPIEKSENIILENEIAQAPIIMRSYIGPGVFDDLPSTYAADVFSYILDQKSSKFNKEIIETGLARFANFGYFTNRTKGPITLTLVPDPTRVEEAMAKIDEHINMWDSDEYFTDEQLQTAKDLLIIDDEYGQETTSNYVKSVSWWWCVKDIETYTNYANAMQSVTRADIKNYVKKYIKGKNNITGIMVNNALRTEMGVDELFKN